MTVNRLLFAQFSDIHFHRGSDSTSDLDADVRNELELDVQRMRGQLGQAHEILINGDIAFSGKPDEYQKAAEWLKKISGFCGCENIRVVPGNHDVDHAAIKGSKHLQQRKIREDIRRQDVTKADRCLHEYLEDDGVRPQLFVPLQSYNEFAKLYHCETGPDHPHWQHNLLLNDGSTLRLHGLNSVLISDDKDDLKANKLVLGKLQCQLRNEPGVTYLTLCHHPPDWFFDQQEVNRILNGRAVIQLTGHKHEQWIEQTDQSLRITSGAMHPSRKEDGWQPRYNYLSIAVFSEGQDRWLDVRIYSRVWTEKKKGGSFMPDLAEGGRDYHAYRLKLDGWTAPKVSYSQVVTPVSTPQGQNVPLMDSADAPQPPSSKMSPQRRLTYRYLSLPYLHQMKVAQELDLLMNEDRGVDDAELFRRIYLRAKSQGKLGQLWDAVERVHPDPQSTTNPFTA